MDLARRINGEAIIIHVTNTPSDSEIAQLQQLTSQLLLDIPHQFLSVTGSIPEEIIRLAQEYQVTDIIVGKRGLNLGNKY